MREASDYKNINFHFLKKDFSLTDRKRLKIFIDELFKKEKKIVERLNYIFCSDDYLLDINKTHLSHDFFTDIITFDLSESKKAIIGEIYISIYRVKENAVTYNSSFKKELHRVIFHGCLHLCGYKDKTTEQSKKMRKKEEEYLKLYFL